MATPKIYTRTGDKGMTGLSDGERVSKDSVRLDAYGTVDELNAIVGICRQFGEELQAEYRKHLDTWLEAMQNDLFNLGSDLATPLSSRWENMVVVGATEIRTLESLIDHCQNILPPLRHFVLPGGTRLNTFLHLARTVCRRAERRVVTLCENNETNPLAVSYLNRLSDFLFVLSRWAQFVANAEEKKWDPTKGMRNLELPG